MNDEAKRKKIRSYFAKSHPGCAIIPVLVGTIVVVLALGARAPEVAVGVAVLFFAIALIWFFVAITRQLRRPSDEQMDQWLEDDLNHIVKRTYDRLGLQERNQRRKPLLIRGPILWSTVGIPNKDLLWKKGKDDIVRFAVYRVTVIHLDDLLLAAYACDFNFLKNVSLNEETDEYHYRNIASVSTHEISTSYKLPNGKSLVHAQAFRLSVVSGENIQVTIGSAKLAELTGGTIPTTEAETAVQVIRTILRDKLR